ncbi:GntR family transcriptional regulator [Rhizobium sp. G21]|uniref:GntR family transcriptional regulator n=1 Tax=Rhizobium sp. G21 TaxID=2758439 RepID=UPI0016006AF7|nr:GntR family transcriptional regulator [Rhizobium sp. G21]MBB1251534.1 GntR family transcriptional regulator [Rhizobium sp. G21]
MNSQAAAKDHRPVYIQIAETLRARIVSGYYDDKVDGELPLAGEFKVSRRTIQQALEILVQEGLLVRQHGMGTFINRKGVEKRYRAITSITEGIIGQGLKPEFTVLSSGPAPATDDERAFFRINPADQTYRHKRLVAAEGRALAVVETSLNLKFLEGLELSHLSQSLYQTMRSQFGRTIVQAEDQYIPAIADEETAELLGIAVGSPVFVAIRRATDQTGAPIELSRIVMLPVPLDISIRNVGFTRPKQEELTPEAREWTYTVGFGDFHR